MHTENFKRQLIRVVFQELGGFVTEPFPNEYTTNLRMFRSEYLQVAQYLANTADVTQIRFDLDNERFFDAHEKEIQTILL